MTWGLPPKIEIEYQFKQQLIGYIHQSTENALMNLNYTISDSGAHFISAEKKMKFTTMSFFTFSKPKISLLILITPTGKLTIKAKYNYSTVDSIACNDGGKLKKHCHILLTEIRDLVDLNYRQKV